MLTACGLNAAMHSPPACRTLRYTSPQCPFARSGCANFCGVAQSSGSMQRRIARAADVEERFDRSPDVRAHVDVARRLLGRCEEASAMEGSFAHGRLERARRVVHAVTAVAETARPAEVRERRHDDARAGAAQAILVGDQRRHAALVAQPIVRQAFDLPGRFQLARADDVLEDVDGRMPRGDHPIDPVPAQAGGRGLGHRSARTLRGQPRSASR